MDDAGIGPEPTLLTPEQVAWKLFEVARLTGWRTHGLDGLSPVADAPAQRFRPRDVDAYIQSRLMGA